MPRCRSKPLYSLVNSALCRRRYDPWSSRIPGKKELGVFWWSMIFSENRHPSPDQVRGQAFSGSCSVDRLDISALDHFGPLGDFGLDIGIEFLRRTAAIGHAEVGEALFGVVVGQRLPGRGVEL